MSVGWGWKWKCVIGAIAGTYSVPLTSGVVRSDDSLLLAFHLSSLSSLSAVLLGFVWLFCRSVKHLFVEGGIVWRWRAVWLGPFGKIERT